MSFLKRWGIQAWFWPLLVSTLVVYGGAILAAPLLHDSDCSGHKFDYAGEWYANWDGQWYKYILLNGYDFDKNIPRAFGPKVFFPLYPLLGRLVYFFTSLKPEWCLLIVTWTALIGLCVVWERYCRLRFPDDAARRQYALLLLLFWPAALFLRVTYTESLFMLLIALLFYGFQKQWPMHRLILVCALATATRPTGIACAAALCCYAWNSSPQRGARRGIYALSAAIAGCAGLFAYMLYLWLSWNDPLLFLHQLQAWSRFATYGGLTMPQRLEMLVTLKPLWSFFAMHPWTESAISWHFQLLNQGTWTIAVLVVAAATVKRWLKPEEIIFALASLGMIYMTTGYRDMVSSGRYTLAVLPLYIGLARLLPQRNPTAIACLVACLASLLFLYSGMFARWLCLN